MSKKMYVAEFLRTQEYVLSFDVEATSEEEAWDKAEAHLQAAAETSDDEYEHQGSNVQLTDVTEV